MKLMIWEEGDTPKHNQKDGKRWLSGLCDFNAMETESGKSFVTEKNTGNRWD